MLFYPSLEYSPRTTNRYINTQLGGLSVDHAKTEYITSNSDTRPALQVYGSQIKHVTDSRYLGFMVATSVTDLKTRKKLSWTAFWNSCGVGVTDYIRDRCKGAEKSIDACAKLK